MLIVSWKYILIVVNSFFLLSQIGNKERNYGAACLEHIRLDSFPEDTILFEELKHIFKFTLFCNNMYLCAKDRVGWI